MNSGSAVTAAVFRCDAARLRDRLRQRHPRSIRLNSSCVTVVMIVEPPGEPSARNGLAVLEHDGG